MLFFAFELLSDATLLLAETLASHEFGIAVSLCHYLLVGLATLVVDSWLLLGLSSLYLVDALPCEGQRAVSVLGS